MPKITKLFQLDIWFKKGEQAFRNNKPNIKNIWSEDEWNPPRYKEQYFWFGWMLERGRGILDEIKNERRKEIIKDYIESGYDLPPNF
jgi:hypothetical protein